MLEEKIEELRGNVTISRSDCKIELDLSYFIPDDFFDSEQDKLRFFRNIESIDTQDDLEYAYKSFEDANTSLPESFENLFLLLKVRIVFKKFKIISLKKIGSSYVFEFDPGANVPLIRKFLDFDTTGDFVLVTVHKIKVDQKAFS